MRLVGIEGKRERERTDHRRSSVRGTRELVFEDDRAVLDWERRKKCRVEWNRRRRTARIPCVSLSGPRSERSSERGQGSSGVDASANAGRNVERRPRHIDRHHRPQALLCTLNPISSLPTSHRKKDAPPHSIVQALGRSFSFATATLRFDTNFPLFLKSEFAPYGLANPGTDVLLLITFLPSLESPLTTTSSSPTNCLPPFPSTVRTSFSQHARNVFGGGGRKGSFLKL